MRFGCHIRTGSGIPAALDYAAGLGCECVQVFAKTPQRWRAPQIPDALAEQVREMVASLGVGPLFTHTAYLINLGSEDDEMWARSTEALADELTRGSRLGAEGVVTHIGTNPTGDADRAASRIAEAVLNASEKAGETAARLLLLEDSAGQGRSFGGCFEELGMIFGRLEEAGLHTGLCIDTCHLHAYGYDLTCEEGWSRIVASLDECCGIDRLRLLHVNDCAGARGAHRDRHAWIGDGEIGERGFAAMVCQPDLKGLPALTESPGEVPAKDVENLRRLRTLRDACAGL